MDRLLTIALLVSLCSGCFLSHGLEGDTDARRPDSGPDSPDGGAPVDASTPEVTPERPVLRYPWNGHTTGSVHVPAGTAAVHPLRPKLVWEASPDAERYEVEMTSECRSEDFRSCRFVDPEVRVTDVSRARFRPTAPLPVSMRAPVGRRYYWRVRACKGEASCSRWSPVRYLDVGRQPSDFDGDGYADPVVAHVRREGDAVVARLDLFRGDAAEPAHVGSRRFELSGDPEHNTASVDIATGDIDADGFGDLLVGLEAHMRPHTERSSPAYTVAKAFTGGPEGITRHAFELTDFPPNCTIGSLGNVGDHDGDGTADFTIGFDDCAMSREGLEPPEHVAMRVATSRDGAGVDTERLSPPAGPGSYPGWTECASRSGDPAGDGLADVLLSAPEWGLGIVAGYSTMDGPQRHPVSEMDFGGRENTFGAAMDTSGDLDGDGFADLVVGAPTEGYEPGAAYVLFGRRDGVSANPEPDFVFELAGSSDLGRSVSVSGDYDADGLSDLVVSYYRDERACLAVYPGSADELSDTPSTTACTESSRSSADHAFRAVGDVNGDGFSDLLFDASCPKHASYDTPMDVARGGCSPSLLAGSSTGLGESRVVLSVP